MTSIDHCLRASNHGDSCLQLQVALHPWGKQPDSSSLIHDNTVSLSLPLDDEDLYDSGDKLYCLHALFPHFSAITDESQTGAFTWLSRFHGKQSVAQVCRSQAQHRCTTPGRLRQNRKTIKSKLGGAVGSTVVMTAGRHNSSVQHRLTKPNNFSIRSELNARALWQHHTVN